MSRPLQDIVTFSGGGRRFFRRNANSNKCSSSSKSRIGVHNEIFPLKVAQVIPRCQHPPTSSPPSGVKLRKTQDQMEVLFHAYIFYFHTWWRCLKLNVFRQVHSTVIYSQIKGEPRVRGTVPRTQIGARFPSLFCSIIFSSEVMAIQEIMRPLTANSGPPISRNHFHSKNCCLIQSLRKKQETRTRAADTSSDSF